MAFTYKDTDPVRLSEDRKSIIILDQTKLPGEVVYQSIDTLDGMYDAIKTLAVRGAPCIGVFAGYCMAVLASGYCGLDTEELREVLNSNRYHDDVVMDEREAAYHGVHAVPFFVINGKYSISGAPDTEGLRQALLKLMAKEAEEQMASGMSCGPEGCKLR